MRTTDFLGYRICADAVQSCAERAWRSLTATGSSHVVACVNPHSIVTAQTDARFATALRNADILLPDGIGVVLGSRALNSGVTERIAGMDFFRVFSQLSSRRGGAKYFFLGSTPSVLESIRARVMTDYPGIEVAGSMSPPFVEDFTEAQTHEMIECVNRSGANVLWLGMTAPKQEKWAQDNRRELKVALIGSIGAVFDFYAGKKRRAPEWVCRIGFEWLPRLLREPRRLWRRSLVSLPLFLMMIAKEKVARTR